MDHDALMIDVDDAITEDQSVNHFVVAVDFGTTFSSVCFACYSKDHNRDTIGLEQVEVINSYPDNPYANIPAQEVPTEIWYVGPSQDVCNEQGRGNRASESNGEASADHNEDELSVFQSFIQSATSPNHNIARGGQHRRGGGRGRGKGSSHRARKKIAPTSGLSIPDASLESKSFYATRSELLLWGYGAQQRMHEHHLVDDGYRRLTRFKLMLSERQEARPVKEQVSERCQALKKAALITEDADIITDYLLQLFYNTKRFLTEFDGYGDKSKIEYVMCVPAIWTRHACRVMEKAMATAVLQSGMGKLNDGAFDNLFIVSEPEAAAACILSETNSRVKFREVFVLIDAGGGTVDAITYEVTHNEPLRMKAEIVEPDGALCGSSYINQRFEKMLKDKLQDAQVLADYHKTKHQMINSLVVDFERLHKHRIDQYITEGRREPYIINIPGLRMRGNASHIQLTRAEYESLFVPSLDAVVELMEKQINGARKKRKIVQKVVLIGGFGQSKSLAAYLAAALRKEEHRSGLVIELIKATKPGTSASAVARGAVMRALRKDHGPQRELRASYGFIRHEPYNLIEYPGHRNQQPIIWPIDGKPYIDYTIEWMLFKGTIQNSVDKIERVIEVTFEIDEDDYQVNEELWVSDSKHKSQYRSDHPLNKGAERLAVMLIDLSRVKIDQQFRVREDNPPHWRITFILVLIVNGRSLCYEVRWPDENKTLINRKSVSLASAFLPGTA